MEQAERPKDFRPIILLPFLYRLWACGSSRSCLPELAKVAGLHQYGYVPQRRVTDLWWPLQSAIEMSFTHDECMVGFNLDLIRCFNHLPRVPLFHAMELLGVPRGLLAAWRKAMANLGRRFKIGQEVGPCHFSTSGFPEGCPLSCLAMVSYNILMDRYLAEYSGSSILTSFVDNIQLLADNVGTLMHSLTTARTFLDMWGLAEDRAKSYVWSTTPGGRAALRAMGFVPRLAAKDLGAQMTFSRLQRTTVMDERNLAASHVWGILRRSCAPGWFKLVTLRQAAWPRILYGCENRKSAPGFTGHLRSKAVHSLGWRRAGASPWIRWSLMHQPDLDPEFYQLWSILKMMFRMCQQFPHVAQHWHDFLMLDAKRGQGPFHSLQQTLAILGWHWQEDLTLDVGFLHIPYEKLHLELLRVLLVDAWDDYVCAQVSHRKDFQGLTSVSRSLSFRPLADDKGTNELMATIQDGTFYTDHQHSKFDCSKTGMCTDCGVENDLAHRCLDCPRYSHIRDEHLPCVQRWHLFSTAFQLHGLVPRNEHLRSLWSYFAALPDTRLAFFFQGDFGMKYNVFTDGTCSTTTDRAVAWVSWRVVLPDCNAIVASGFLPGLMQTNNRGELFAILVALHWKLRVGCQICIWTDSLYCVTNFEHIRQHGSVPESWSNRDLWLEALALALVVDWSTCQIVKVKAHMNPHTTDSPYEDGLLRGNDMADTVAKRQNHSRDPAFYTLLQNYEDRHLELQELATSQRQFLLAISKFDLGQPYKTQADPEDELIVSLGRHHEPNQCHVAAILEPLLEDDNWSSPLFERDFLHDLSAWLAGLDILAPFAAPISLVELVIGFCICTGKAFPIALDLPGPRYRYPAQIELGALARPTLAASAAVMGTALKIIFQIAQADLLLEKHPRHSVGVGFSVSCLRVGVPLEICDDIQRRLAMFSTNSIRCARDLARPYQHIV